MAYLSCGPQDFREAASPCPKPPSPPLPRPTNILCVGRNYAEHAEEEGETAPEDPALFLKATTSVVADGDDVVWDPSYTAQIDYEAELALIIGKPARSVEPEQALEHVLGYTCLNGISARDLQFADLQWSRGKSLDTFCQMDPALVTSEEVGDPQQLEIRCLLNGAVVQQANTSLMYHSVGEIISYCSRAMTLHPGTSSPPAHLAGWASFVNRRCCLVMAMSSRSRSNAWGA